MSIINRSKPIKATIHKKKPKSNQKSYRAAISETATSTSKQFKLKTENNNTPLRTHYNTQYQRTQDLG
jgi:hypothetical protein